MASPEQSVLEIQRPHPHAPTEVCPLCEQPIPEEKLVQIQQRERERAKAHEAELRAQFDNEKASALAKQEEELRKSAAMAVEKAQLESVARERTAIAEATKQAEAAMAKKLAEAETAKSTAEKDRTLVTEELEQLKAESAKTEAAFAEREQNARAEATRQAEAAMAKKLAEAETAKSSAEEGRALVAEQLEQLKAESGKAEVAFAEREQNARAEATKQAEATMAKKLAEAETAKKDLETALAEQQRSSEERLTEQREALERDKTEAVQKEQSKAFSDRQKMERELQKLQRQVQKQRADELGEEAELVLSDALREAFPDDGFRAIDKGVAGADLWQDVTSDGELCGRIVFDSKNRNAWRSEYVAKLKTDQLNAKGDCAILATRVFPSKSKTRQLHVQDGVILAHPARVVALVTIVREYLIHARRLKLSADQRDAKTAALYDFITSERCHQIFDHHETTINALLELDVTEKKQHEKTWNQRGQLVKKAQRAKVQLLDEINRIVVEGEMA